MRILSSVLMLVVLLGCGAHAPEGEESTKTDDASVETRATDELEGVEEEAALEAPPEGSVPLAEILAKLEALGYTEIIETDFEDGVWEVDYVADGEEHELLVDPMTGEILPEKPKEFGDD